MRKKLILWITLLFAIILAGFVFSGIDTTDLNLGYMRPSQNSDVADLDGKERNGVNQVYWRVSYFNSKSEKGSLPKYLTEFGRETVNIYFVAPKGVAVGQDESVYITEGNGKVFHFTAGGKYIRHFAGHGSGKTKLKYPYLVAVGIDGSVFVADTGNDRVQKYDSKGKHMKSWGGMGSGNGQFRWIYGIAVAPDGSVYTTEISTETPNFGNHRVQKFDPNGNFILSWKEGKPSDWFYSEPHGVHVADDSTVFVALRGHERVNRYQHNGKQLHSLWLLGKEKIDFESPVDVAVAGGTVFVTDRYAYRIQECRYDEKLKSFKSSHIWGKTGKGKSQFDYPIGIAASQNGVLYVCDSWNNRVQAFRIGGIYGVVNDSVTLSGKIVGAQAQDYASILVLIKGTDTDREKFEGYSVVSKTGDFQFSPFPKGAKYTITLEGVNAAKYKNKTKKITGRATKTTKLKDFVLSPIDTSSSVYLTLKKVKYRKAEVDPFKIEKVKLTLTGTNFMTGMAIESDSPQLTFPADSLKVMNSKKAQALMHISAGARKGTYSLKFQNPDGEVYIAVNKITIK